MYCFLLISIMNVQSLIRNICPSAATAIASNPNILLLLPQTPEMWNC